jgi:hypothetical protein
MRLPRDEQVVRAIFTAHYDAVNGRGSYSLYEGVGTSVSRLAVIPLIGQWGKFAAIVQKLPGHRLEKIGQLGVGQIEDIGKNFARNGKPAPTPLSVLDDPTPQNEAHAIIPEKITPGLSRVLNTATIVHDPPAGFNPELLIDKASYAKKIVAKRPPTIITAHANIGFGNTLYLRGDGPGLSWDKGVPLDCLSDDKWSLAIEHATPFTFRVLLNDLVWCTGDNYTAAPGASIEITPEF